jgi:capsular polysaccharide biosynthesis protein
LQVAAERTTLAAVLPSALAGPVTGPGLCAEIEGGEIIPAATLKARTAGKVGGTAPIPAWARGEQDGFRGDVTVSRTGPVWALPRFGAVIDAQGRVFASTVGESLSWNPDLAALPFVRRRGGARVFAPPDGAPGLPAASLFMAKGGEFNYGHFLLDCLPALSALDQLGLARDLPPIAPVLKPWSRDLLRLAFPGLAVRETGRPVVRLGEAAFCSAMDHYLHRPAGLVAPIRERILASAPRSGTGPRRVYISRRAYPMRVMVDEPALEDALSARGFVIARPEKMGAAEQIALVRDAEVLVGPTGAGLANALFAPQGAKVVEIQPETFTSWWLRDLVLLLGQEWHGWFCPAPVDAGEVSWRYRVRRGFRWGYRLGVEAFLRFLDERL